MPLEDDNSRVGLISKNSWSGSFHTYDTDTKHRLSCGNQVGRRGDNQATVF